MARELLPIWHMWRAVFRHPWRLCLLIFLGLRCFSCLPQDQFECEDAAARLRQCCDAAAVSRCDYKQATYQSGGGCSGSPLVITHLYETPELMGPDAVCLIQSGCDAVQAAGACLVSSWLLPAACTTTSSGMDFTEQDCVSPAQDGPCEQARPGDACQALRRLQCR